MVGADEGAPLLVSGHAVYCAPQVIYLCWEGSGVDVIILAI